MEDLHTNVIELYADHWEELANFLDLKQHDIDAIIKENENSPTKLVDCCTSMFNKWLQKDPLPTWNELENAVKKLSSYPYDVTNLAGIII